MIGMRERAMAAGGTLEITANEAGGTVVEVCFPWDPGDAPGESGGPTPA